MKKEYYTVHSCKQKDKILQKKIRLRIVCVNLYVLFRSLHEFITKYITKTYIYNATSPTKKNTKARKPKLLFKFGVQITHIATVIDHGYFRIRIHREM